MRLTLTLTLDLDLDLTLNLAARRAGSVRPASPCDRHGAATARADRDIPVAHAPAGGRHVFPRTAWTPARPPERDRARSGAATGGCQQEVPQESGAGPA
ncbi:hypothetical protein GCM10010278_81250 [Streptomyces melanogenes]|nr:hypothetical protein GCM10010278_81250 [Streptomyces melanogenes]